MSPDLRLSTLVMAAGEWEWLSKTEEAINSAFTPVAEAVTSVIFYAPTVGDVSFPLIVLWLVVAAIVFTIYFRGPQFTSWRTSCTRSNSVVVPLKATSSVAHRSR